MANLDRVYAGNVNSFGHLLDRLVVENIKLTNFLKRMEAEQRKEKPDSDLIVRLDLGHRKSNEARSVIKNEIDRLLSDVMAAGEYRIIEETRTWTTPNDPQDASVEEDASGDKLELKKYMENK